MIFEQLGPVSAARVAEVCRRFNNLIGKSKVVERFGRNHCFNADSLRQ